ncbi:Zinc finger MYM-type protein 6, partial [Zootermopsis nevadensis]
KRKGNFVRHYDKEYLKLGFIVAPGSELSPRPLCVICSEVLSNDAMKPSKLARHLHSKHRDFTDKPLDVFNRLRDQMKLQKTQMKTMTISDKSLLKASYLVALRIAKTKKLFTIGEELVQPCILDVVQEILGPQATKKLEAIPLSDTTIQRRIVDMAIDIEKQVVEGINKSRCFAIQLDESTDVTQGLDWSKCVGVCTDGAASMTGRRSGVVAKIKEVAHPEVLFTDCMIHRKHLAAKKLSTELNTVMNDAVKIINEIRSRATNSRLFTTLCESMDSHHQHLLLHAEVRVLARPFELREEVKQFLRERKSDLVEPLFNEEWMTKLTYMPDIFNLMNELNISVQGSCTNIFTLRNKMDAFKKKLALWDSRVQEEDIEMFPLLGEFLNAADINQKVIFNIISQHLRALAENFNNYFPENEDPRKGNLWINNPFLEDIKSCALDLHEKEKLIELSSDVTLVSRHKMQKLPQFCISLDKEYPSLSYKAIKLLVVFSTSYLCEKTFPAMSVIKTKQRNRVDVNPALR